MGESPPGADPDLKCPRCGAPHDLFACQYVKAIEFADGFVDGSPSPPRIARIEFLTPADYGRAPAETPPSPEYSKL